MFYAGIDIGKFIHEITLIDDCSSKPESLRFKNTREGFEKLEQFLPEPSKVKISIEATGHYWITVYHFLVQKNYSVLVVNPLQTDAYRETKLRKTKTDRQDSFLLADLMRLNLVEETPVAPAWAHQLKSLSRFHFGLVDQIANLKRQLLSILDKVFPEGEIGDISRFANKNKLVAFAGIDPTIYSSGEYTAPQAHMSKRGSPYLRRALWLAATVARKHDKELKQLYERKINQGKHYGTAIGAVARRLVNRLFVVLKEQRPYQPSPVNS